MFGDVAGTRANQGVSSTGMQLFCKTLTGATITLDAEEQMTIARVKQLIHEQVGMSAS